MNAPAKVKAEETSYTSGRICRACFRPIGQPHAVDCPLAAQSALQRKLDRRITSRQEGGDDGYSYAIRIDGRLFVNGLTRSEVPYYRGEARRQLTQAQHDHVPAGSVHPWRK